MFVLFVTFVPFVPHDSFAFIRSIRLIRVQKTESAVARMRGTVAVTRVGVTSAVGQTSSPPFDFQTGVEKASGKDGEV